MEALRQLEHNKLIWGINKGQIWPQMQLEEHLDYWNPRHPCWQCSRGTGWEWAHFFVELQPPRIVVQSAIGSTLK